MKNGVAGEELTVFMVVSFLQERQGEPQDSIARNHLPEDHGHEPIEAFAVVDTQRGQIMHTTNY